MGIPFLEARHYFWNILLTFFYLHLLSSLKVTVMEDTEVTAAAAAVTQRTIPTTKTTTTTTRNRTKRTITSRTESSVQYTLDD